MFQTKLADKNAYIININRIKLRPDKLQKSDEKTQKIKVKSLKRYKDIDKVLYYQKLPFILKIILNQVY